MLGGAIYKRRQSVGVAMPSPPEGHHHHHLYAHKRIYYMYIHIYIDTYITPPPPRAEKNISYM